MIEVIWIVGFLASLVLGFVVYGMYENEDYATDTELLVTTGTCIFLVSFIWPLSIAFFVSFLGARKLVVFGQSLKGKQSED